MIPSGVYRDENGAVTATAQVGPPGSGDGPALDGGATDTDAATTAGDGSFAPHGEEGCGCEVARRPAASGDAPLLLLVIAATRRRHQTPGTRR